VLPADPSLTMAVTLAADVRLALTGAVEVAMVPSELPRTPYPLSSPKRQNT